MTIQVLFSRISIRGVRNLSVVDFDAAPRLNVIAGDNAQGKTSILEALYLVATSRSFRTERLRELIQDGEQVASVRATATDGSAAREQRAVVGQTFRKLSVDGKRPTRAAAYATRTPVVVFHPGDLTLISGPAAGRRTLLDRVALFRKPASAEHRRRYQRALRERGRALEERGPGASDLEAYEHVMAEAGAELARDHASAAEDLIRALGGAFTRLAPDDVELGARFVPAGCEEATAFAAELARRRAQDLRRRGATFGPHRDDLELLIGGRSARRHASQGQQRILTLALKIAELDCVREARGAYPVLLLDDVSSELDPARTGAVYALLRDTPGQVFVTTTRPELLTTPDLGPGERTDWVVDRGRLDPAR